MASDTPDTINGIPIATKQTVEQLDHRQLLDYEHIRTQFIEWMLTFGTDPQSVEGYSETTARSRADKHDQFCRWVWGEEGKYTMNLTHDHADGYMKHLAFSDLAASSRPTYQKAVKAYFRWREHEFGADQWEPERSFSYRADVTKPKDFITKEERKLLREAALEYGSVPNYHSVTPAERRDWKEYLARRFEKPLDQIGKEDWERANGWKYPSLIWTALDTGLRPIEVKRATVQWVDTDRQLLCIPREASKNDEAWETALTSRTTMALREWIRQRDNYPRYEGRDKLWLTKYGNPYDSNNLSNLVQRLCEIADISTENRDVTFYSIRRGVITSMIEEGDLSAAQQQARHKDPRSTMRYNQPTADRRRNVLNKLE